MFEELLKSLFAPFLKRMDEQTGEIRSLRALVAAWLLPAPQGELRVTLRLAEDGSMQAIVTLPPLPNPLPTGLKSISMQNFYVTDGGGTEVFREQYPIDGSVLDANPVPVEIDGAYRAWCSYEDGRTPPNVSEAVFQDFVAKDDVPPDAPGPFGAIRFTE